MASFGSNCLPSGPVVTLHKDNWRNIPIALIMGRVFEL
jgi:hypothetical protein